MARPSFNDLVRELVEAHERETASLRLEIERLRELLGGEDTGGKLNGHSQLEGQDYDDGVPSNDETVPTTDANSLTLLAQPQRKISTFLDVDVDVPSEPALEAYAAPEASVGLALYESLPERETFARAVAQKIAPWIGATHGFGGYMARKLLHGLSWWMSLTEPPRTGLLASIVNSKTFTLVCYVMIALNAVLIVHSSNKDMERALHNDLSDNSEEARSYIIANSVFILFYTMELLLKFCVHRLYMLVNDDYKWNLLDIGLVAFGAIDLFYAVFDDASGEKNVATNWSFLRLLRIVRVVKVFRALKAVESVHDVSLMLDCVTNTTATLFWCLVLMMFVVAIFGLIFVQTLAAFVVEQQDTLDMDLRNDIHDKFGNVRIAMTSLFEATTGGVDWHEQYELCGKAGFGLQLVYLFFQAFFVIVAWNVVTSMFVEKAFRLAVPDAEQLIHEKQHRDARYAAEMMRLLENVIDANKDGRITFEEFKARISQPSFRNFFEVRGVDFKNPKAFFEMLRTISGSDTVDYKTFVACCLQLQGAATNIDLQSLHHEVRRTLLQQGDRLAVIEDSFRKTANLKLPPSDGGTSGNLCGYTCRV